MLHKSPQLPKTSNLTLKASNCESASKSRCETHIQKLTNCPQKSDATCQEAQSQDFSL